MGQGQDSQALQKQVGICPGHIPRTSTDCSWSVCTSHGVCSCLPFQKESTNKPWSTVLGTKYMDNKIDMLIFYEINDEWR